MMKHIVPAVGALLLSLIGGVAAHHLLTFGEGRSGFLVLCVSATVAGIIAARSVWLAQKKRHGGFPARIVAAICYAATALLFADFGRLPDFIPRVRIAAASAACGFAVVAIAILVLGSGKTEANQTPDRTRLARPEVSGSTPQA